MLEKKNRKRKEKEKEKKKEKEKCIYESLLFFVVYKSV
jgi:hypothetical protein